MSTSAAPTNRCPVPYPSLESVECVYDIFRDLREEGGVREIPGHPGEFLVGSHALLSEVLRDPVTFSSQTPLNAEAQPGWEASVFSSDPPDHTVKRNVVYQSFKPGKLREYTPMIHSVVDGLIDDFVDDKRVEFVSQFAELMSSRIMFNLLGLSWEDSAWIADIDFEGGGARYLPDEMRIKLDEDGMRVHQYMAPIVAERAENLGDDVISDLIRGHRKLGGPTNNLDYLTVESTVVLLGGVLTSAHLTGSAMWLLLEHPDQLERVIADHRLIPQALEEALRVESSQQFLTRFTTTDVELGGVHIPAGSVILVVYAAGNRDPEVFPEPERFDIDRRNVKRHLGFGLGVHFCVGAPLARLEARIAFEALFTRLKNLRYAPGKNDFRHKPSAFIRGLRKLELEFD